MSVGERVEAPSVFCGVNRSIVSGCFFVCVRLVGSCSQPCLSFGCICNRRSVCVELIEVDWP